MTNQPTTHTQHDAQRVAHLEALAQLVYRFVEHARAIDARYTPEYADMARELRPLGTPSAQAFAARSALRRCPRLP
jgi:hypothetical protein